MEGRRKLFSFAVPVSARSVVTEQRQEQEQNIQSTGKGRWRPSHLRPQGKTGTTVQAAEQAGLELVLTTKNVALIFRVGRSVQGRTKTEPGLCFPSALD